MKLDKQASAKLIELLKEAKVVIDRINSNKVQDYRDKQSVLDLHFVLNAIPNNRSDSRTAKDKVVKLLAAEVADNPIDVLYQDLHSLHAKLELLIPIKNLQGICVDIGEYYVSMHAEIELDNGNFAVDIGVEAYCTGYHATNGGTLANILNFHPKNTFILVAHEENS
jgi:hypothetical protein